MRNRMLLVALLSLTAVPALAADTSPFYRGPYAVETNPAVRADGPDQAAPAKAPEAVKLSLIHI